MTETRCTILEKLERDSQALLLFVRQIDAKLQALLALFPVKLRLRFGTPERRDDLPPIGPPNMNTLIDDEHVAVTLEADDAVGNVAVFDFSTTPATWSSSDPTIITVSQNTDGSNADVVTTGKLGTAQIRVDAVTGAGNPITGLGEVEVVAGGAASFKLNFGTPAKK